jgi:hypothetical protein
MGRGLAVTLACVLIGLAEQATATEPPSGTPDPHAVAVNIERTPVQAWPGYGIYLGNGLVITAAHVVGHALLTQPKVVVEGQRLATAPVKEGSFPDQDLTVLRITDPVPSDLATLHTTLCSDPTHPGEAVVVATPEKVTSSAMEAPEALPPDLRGRYGTSSIKDVYTTGNSGSGVFDADSRCLRGIMSAKIEQHLRLIVNGEHVVRTVGVGKIFVPAADIRAFLAGLPAP